MSRVQLADSCRSAPCEDNKGPQPAQQLFAMTAGKMTKPDLGNGVSHPARFSLPLIPVFAEILKLHPFKVQNILDPFAGTGRVHLLADSGFVTTGVELQPKWAHMHADTIVGDATDLPFSAETFDAIVTSPTYANRCADHHEAKDGSLRRTYTHDYGEELEPNNSGAMQWGDQYRELHNYAWQEAQRVLVPGGVMVLNIKDHVRAGVRQYVSGWHVTTLCQMGFELLYHVEVPAPGMRAGANSDLRMPAEQVYVFEKLTNEQKEKNDNA
jgi:SAM-dependent methyltransferase